LWHQDIDVGVPALETRMEVWPNLGDDWEEDIWDAETWGEVDSDGNDVEPPYWCVNWNRRNFNRKHPWVQTQLPLMPRFEPVIMFRHCVGWCSPIKGYPNRSRYLTSKVGPKRLEHN
jgi:hypothetical protein